jgi:tRNA nucleotidyltransferase (CCA-adding enzyme)
MSINKILAEIIKEVKPEKGTFDKIKIISNDFCKELDKRLKKAKIKAEVFIGGSLAKETMIKKDKYDADIFVRFESRYKEEDISGLLEKVIGKDAKKIHGSRDYYQIFAEGLILEVIPVIKVKKPSEAQNITDLSYFHVKYIKERTKKNKRLGDEILLAKTFAHVQGCYGAESYIKGFSGYSLELLICHYGSFLKLVKELSKHDSGKIVIDDKKYYKNKNEVLLEMNESKLQSPIILVDPTFKERNVLAGLSEETFNRFKEACINLIKNSSKNLFKKKDAKEELEKKYKERLKTIKVWTTKQKGDIAGTKSKKFFDFFSEMIKREFEIKERNFEYDETENAAYFYFVVERKGEEIITGPHITKTENLASFKKKHKDAFIKEYYSYAKISHNLSFEEFFKAFEKKYKEIMRQMDIKEIILFRN